MVQNQKNLSLVRNVEYPISETKSRTHKSITTFSGKPSVEKVQVSYLSRWTRTMRLCETMMVDNRVSVCCFFLVQQEGTSIHRTKGFSEHNALGVTSCLVHSKKIIWATDHFTRLQTGKVERTWVGSWFDLNQGLLQDRVEPYDVHF